MIRSLFLAAGSFACGIVVATSLVSTVGAQDRKTETKELLRADLGEWCPGKEAIVTTTTNTIGSTVRHFHPGHTFSVVTAGSQTVYPDGKAPYTVNAGELIYEMPFQVSATRTTDPTKVVIVRILEKGKPASIPAP